MPKICKFGNNFSAIPENIVTIVKRPVWSSSPSVNIDFDVALKGARTKEEARRCLQLLFMSPSPCSIPCNKTG
eukprot:1656895-Rhodomonas_salina.1